MFIFQLPVFKTSILSFLTGCYPSKSSNPAFLQARTQNPRGLPQHLPSPLRMPKPHSSQKLGVVLVLTRITITHNINYENKQS